MRRVAPSTMVRDEIQNLFTNGVDRGTNILSALAELGVRYLAQQGLEQEQEDHLHRGRYERRSAEQPEGWRNGYEDVRLKTAEGEMAVRLPQVRGAGGPYRSGLMEFLDGHSDVLERLVTEMYARGLPTRDVEDAFKDATGTLLISRSAVSEITDQLWEDYQAFCAPGMINAITAAFRKSIRIRCWFHRMANIRAKLPTEGAEEFMAHVRAVRDAPTHQAGEARRRDRALRRSLPGRGGLLGRGPGGLPGPPEAPAAASHQRPDHEPHRAELRGRAPADQGDPPAP